MGTQAEVISASLEVHQLPSSAAGAMDVSRATETSRPSTPGGAEAAATTTRPVRASNTSGAASLPGSEKKTLGNASTVNPFARQTRARPSLPNPASARELSPQPSSSLHAEPSSSMTVDFEPSLDPSAANGYGQDPPADRTSSAHSNTPNGAVGSDVGLPRPAQASPVPVVLAAMNGTAGFDALPLGLLNRSRGIASGCSTPLSSPPATEPSPPLYLSAMTHGLSRLSGATPNVSLSLPPSSAPGSPKPLTAAQKGKGKAAAEPRIVRARRSTASLGMAVGMGGMTGVGERKEIEELVRECRDRMATPGMTDGTDLPPILLTTLALDDVRPAPTIYDPNAASTSTALKPPVVAPLVALAQAQIETPSFRIVDAKEDEERSGRLRKRAEESEETMDAHYHLLHKKYETFEKRQRRREKERLQHERYKMKERVDLIRTMDARSFASLVASGDPPPEDGTLRRAVHPEEIRVKMLEEAEEVLKRYDQLLENRIKQKRLEDLADDSGSDASSPGPSASSTFTRTASSLRLSTSSHPNPPTKSSLSIKLRMPNNHHATHSSALPFHPSKAQRKSKRVRISAYDELSTSEEDESEEEVVPPAARTSTRPVRGRASLPPAAAVTVAVEEPDEFAFWPRTPFGGVPMLERTAERHLESVVKDLAEAAKAEVEVEVKPDTAVVGETRSTRRTSAPVSLPEIEIKPEPLDPPPAKRAKKDIKPVRKTLAGARSARFDTPWGIKIPPVVKFKNEFDLDGEFWVGMLGERVALRSSAQRPHVDGEREREKTVDREERERAEAAATLEALFSGGFDFDGGVPVGAREGDGRVGGEKREEGDVEME